MFDLLKGMACIACRIAERCRCKTRASANVGREAADACMLRAQIAYKSPSYLAFTLSTWTSVMLYDSFVLQRAPLRKLRKLACDARVGVPRATRKGA